MSHENIMRLWNDCVKYGVLRPRLRVIVKTADYTVTPDDYGTVLTTRGGSAGITFTLPAAGSTNNGEWALFVNVADNHMIVSGERGGLVVFNNLTADNIGYGDASELIAGTFLAISDGTSWIVLPLATETQSLGINASSTSTSTSTPTSTSTSTGTSTSTSTSTATSTSTSTSSATASTSGTTISASATASKSATATATATPTATSTKTATATATGTATPTATATGTQ